MAGMLMAAGVGVRFRFGDYAGSVLDTNSARTIFLGQVG
jgi:hypothetical protein